MNRTVILQMRSAYGTQRIYPMNETAKRFADLCGRKTLLAEDLTMIKALGYEIEWLPQTLSVSTEGE